ncbi:MAG: TonB-dependent receptor [Bryobacterales bacterium]|nr:TonB-dependent receptor [Bryobacterales bacterium]
MKALLPALFLSALLCPSLAFSQAITGTIAGTVTDSSGAAVPGAKVIATNMETNVTVTVESDAGGNYTATLLPRGTYSLEVSATGFKKASRPNILVAVQQTIRADVTLTVGDVSESVQVTAESFTVETETSALAKIVDNRAIVNLPLNTRNVYNLVFLTPGVTGTVGNSYGDMRYSVNGGRQRTMDTLIDGVTAAHPTVNGFAGISVFPSVDAIEEFKLLGATYPAEFGRSLGSVLNIVFKSGGNQFHGSAYEFLRNSKLDSNNFFDNGRGRQLASFKRSQFGGVFNGPIKKDKTFFMVSMEALRERSAAVGVFTVPTELERRGDFSQTRVANGQLIQVFDPATTRPGGSGNIRDAFAGNVIPANRLDPVAANVMKFYPLPNTPPTGVTTQNNYTASVSRPLDMTMSDYRIDQVLSSSKRLFGRYSTRLNENADPAYFPKEQQIAEGRIIQEDHVHGGVIDYTQTITPTTIYSARAGVARTLYVFNNQGLGFVPSSLGLPSYIDTGVDFLMFPGFAPGGGYRSLGGGDHRRNGFISYTTAHSVSKIMGKHSLKFGADIRLMRVNTNEARSAGSFNFSAAGTQGPNPNQASATAGIGLASMLLGFGSSGTIQNTYKNVATQSWYHAFYVQDDFRVSKNLTLNLGLRWDIDTPRTERYNRTNYFDPTVATPVSQQMQGVTGGLVFVGIDGRPRTQFQADKNNWGPRVGLSWQFMPKTVLRTGFAMLYGPSQQAAAGTIGTMGFRADTSWVTTLDGGLTPANYLRNPFPQGITPTQGARLGVLTQLGDRIEATTQDIVSPYSQQFDINLQRELPFDLTLEAAYVRTRGFYLHRNDEGGLSLNQLDPQYLSLGARLNDRVANPLLGRYNAGIFSAATITRAQSLRPYPQFTDIIPVYSVGARSWYDSLQVTLNKRFSKGLQINTAYTWAKNLDEGMAHQNSYDIRAQRALADIDVAHRLTLGYVYELPWGRGRKFGSSWSRPMDLLIGSWQLNGITTFASGTPLQMTASNSAGIFNMVTRPNNNGQSAKVDGPVHQRLSRYFNPAVFSQPAPFTFGNLSPRVADLRNDGIRHFDLSLFKDFNLTERLRLQLRGEALNAFNTPRFGGPNTSVTSSTVGVITGQANSPRQIQLGLKLLF